MTLPKEYKKYKKILIIILIIVAFQFILPHQVLAQELQNQIDQTEEVKFIGPVIGLTWEATPEEKLIQQAFGFRLPEIDFKEPSRIIYLTVTAYSSTPDQTDSTPFVTAIGTKVRDGIIASNFLRIGTQVRFPEIYGDKIFVVEDRMNPRYYYRADIWMESRDQAQSFGKQFLKMEIL